MKKYLWLNLIAFLFLMSCSMTMDISKDSRFKDIVGHAITTKMRLRLYEINPSLDSYRDRYKLGGNILGEPLVGMIPTGQSVYFERAIRRSGVEVSSEYLEGKVEYRKRTYSIAYGLGLSDGNCKDFWTGLHNDFNFSTSPLEAEATPAKIYH
jgi:hypothetical protein